MIGYKKCLYFDTDENGHAFLKYALVTLEPLNDDDIVCPITESGSLTYCPDPMFPYPPRIKLRCASAKVLSVVDAYDQEKEVSCAFSIYNVKKRLSYGFDDEAITMYVKGQVVVADTLDKSVYSDCTNGIHFFAAKEDALSYVI